MGFPQQIAGLFASLEVKEALPLLEIPPEAALGDYALPCFHLARERKKAPQAVAQELAAQLAGHPDATFLAKVVATGPYVNFFIKPATLIKAAFEETARKPLGKTMVIDYSSPNIAKPFGIGHLRSTVIGGALKRVYAYAGWKTVGINHLGDWGTQFGKLIVAYKRWPVDIAHSETPIKDLLALYVRFHAEAEKDLSLEEAARAEFKRLEEGDAENTALWQQFRDLSLAEFGRLYEKMHVSFESTAGEAFYNDKMTPVVDELQEKGLLEKDDGALVVKFDPEERFSVPAIIIKSDGATTYMTRDLAAILYRKQTYNFDRILYEIGSEQNLHLRQLFAIVKRMGHPWWTQCFHVNHGLYRFEEGKMSTRKGQVVFIEDVLAQAVERTLATIKEKNPDLSDKEAVAERVAVGAIIFNDLKNDRILDIIFDWDEILDFEGESGPYLMYTHARLRSILRKSDQQPLLDPTMLADEEGLAVARHLLLFDTAIDQVVENNKPHTLARWLLGMAALINSYYQKHRVIQEDKMLEQARLALVSRVADRLKLGLELLGIWAPEEM